MARPSQSWGAYLRKAFLWHWNLLLFPAGLIAAGISGIPSVAFPLVIAAEVAYLGGLAYHPKFRKAIDVQAHAEAKALPEANGLNKARNRFNDVVYNLDLHRKRRFKDLQERCQEMQKIARGIRSHAGGASDDSLHTSSLNRMLWVFVKLLASQQGTQRFIESSNELQLQQRVNEIEERLGKTTSEKLRRALADSLTTAKLRVNNMTKAKENAEFIDIELDRIEDKIKALVEMAVAHEDPDFISSQVDSVAESMDHTEAAMREMSLPGLDDDYEEEIPVILETA